VGGATSPVASTSYSYKVDQPAFSLLNGGQYPTKYIATTADAWFTDDDSNATICVGITPVTPVAGPARLVPAHSSRRLSSFRVRPEHDHHCLCLCVRWHRSQQGGQRHVFARRCSGSDSLNKPVDIRLIKEAR